jgi:hypothetical protein
MKDRRSWNVGPRVWAVSLLFFLSASLRAGARGTTVVVLRAEPNSVVIATDSLAEMDGRPASVCKIDVLKHVVVTMAGTVSDPESNFNAFALAEQAVSQSLSLRDAANRFSRDGLTGFKAALERLRRTDRNYYETEILQRAQPLQVVFAGIQDGVTQYVIVYFTVTDDPSEKVVVTPHRESCPGSACLSVGTTDINVLGENAAVGQESRGRSASLGTDAVSIARAIVAAEISNTPRKVGPPISIVSISSTGRTWIERGMCKE